MTTDIQTKLPPIGREVLLLLPVNSDREGSYILDTILEIKDGYANLENLADWYELPDYWIEV